MKEPMTGDYLWIERGTEVKNLLTTGLLRPLSFDFDMNRPCPSFWRRIWKRVKR